MAKKKVEWVICMGNGELLWDEGDFCLTRGEARSAINRIKLDIFEPWNKGVVLPLSILRREWAIVDERKVR